MQYLLKKKIIFVIMLIQTAIDILTSQLTALPWVENFGGVTQKVSVPSQSGDGTIYKTIPVSCSTTFADCNKNQRYTALSPDSSKKSVLYWEVLQALTDQGQLTGQSNRRILTGRARLVGWLNTSKLGINECNTAAKAARSIVPLLYKQYQGFAPDTIYTSSMVRFEMAGEQIKDSRIFANYTYDKNIDGMLLHPYDYFALDVNITVHLTLCDYTLDTGVPIDCVDYSKL
jgi:hypothetical protein